MNIDRNACRRVLGGVLCERLEVLGLGNTPFEMRTRCAPDPGVQSSPSKVPGRP
jgi:hypothetical protein